MEFLARGEDGEDDVLLLLLVQWLKDNWLRHEPTNAAGNYVSTLLH